MARNITVGIDVGTRSTRVVVAEYVKGGDSPVILGAGVAPSRGLRHGYITNEHDAIKSIRAAVQAAERSSGVKIRNAFLSIGGVGLESLIAHGSENISKVDGEVTNLDIARAIEASRKNLTNTANKKIICTIPLRFRIDGKDVLGRPQGMKGAKLDTKVLFIAAMEQHVDDLVHAVEEAGIEVEDIAAAPIAASLVALSKKQRTVGCLLANIGAETVSIAVFEDDTPISLQVFPIGSTDITNDIALGLQVPLEEAEKIKVEGGTATYSKKKLEEIIDARLSDIFELIEAHLKKIKRSGLLPAGVILTGGGVGISSIEDFAKSALKLPSKVAIPEISKNQKGAAKDSSWFVAYGLCIYGFEHLRRERSAKMLKTVRDQVLSWVKQFLP